MCQRSYTELREALRDSPLIRCIVGLMLGFAWVIFGVLVFIVLSGDTHIAILIIAGLLGLVVIVSFCPLVAMCHNCYRREPVPVLPLPTGATAPRALDLVEGTNPMLITS
jgi:hypothetical protein